ncbi:cell division inhibitor SulA [Saccharospirillum mangrovi]|uniref:cell division inhibitor SulA n=1 Tax=Saccharospirillum mangrovi TaxID=2161747 RepID=UPI000D3455AF|nr:SulA-like leucine-rich domain-containing protein [Saccharospirillum mangrovi]
MHAHQSSALALQQPQHWKSSRAQPSRAPASTTPLGAFTEVMCHHGGLNQLQLLVPTLAKLSQEQERWITFIAPPCLPNNSALKRAGVDTRKVRVVHTRSVTDYWKTLQEALENGLSSTVLAWPPHGEFNDLRREVLKQASMSGHTQTFVFRQLGSVAVPATSTEESTQQLALAL